MAKKRQSEGVIKMLEVRMEAFFGKKLPSLPTKVKEIIVKFGPWIAGVIILLSLPTLLAALGLSYSMLPGYWRYGYHFGYSISWWISVAAMVLVVIALPGLTKRKISSWRLVFYSELVMAFYYLVTFDWLGGLIIGTGISMYILFQIKSFYK